MDGIVLIDKPEGFTSHDVVMKMRRLFGTKQVGHTGTLDPMATGLLPICIGKATKVAEFIANDKKAYIAEAVRGIRTDTGDTKGIIYAKSDIPIPQDLSNTLTCFLGETFQLPPMHSALKYKGKKLYEYARKGICVPRKKRPIYIHGLELLTYSDEEISICAEVSSGTYIRTLIDDIGVQAGCFFTMSRLCRISVGNHRLENAFTLDEIEEMSEAERHSTLVPMDQMLEHIPAIYFPEKRLKPMLNGMSTRINFSIPKSTIYRVYGGEYFVGLGVVKESDSGKEVFMKKVLG